MSRFEIDLDLRKLEMAMVASPALLTHYMGGKIKKGIYKISRTARGNAPKAFSELTNAIQPTMVTPLHGEVRVGKDYGPMAEFRTGPGGWPAQDDIEDWIRIRGITPNDPGMDERDLGFVIARSIAQKGTPAQPYLFPAFEQHKAGTERDLDKALDQTLEAMART